MNDIASYAIFFKRQEHTHMSQCFGSESKESQ